MTRHAQSLGAGAVMTPTLHAASRWVSLLLPVIVAVDDPHGLEDWATLCGRRPRTIRQTCEVVGVGAHESLTLSRVLRAVRLASLHRLRPCDVLEVEDSRTLRRVGSLCGIDLQKEGP